MDGLILGQTSPVASGEKKAKRQPKKALNEEQDETDSSKQLFDWGWCHSLRKEEAIVVRYLIAMGGRAGDKVNWDLRREPPRCPSLANVVGAQARIARHR
jgi:hypothetical protein